MSSSATLRLTLASLALLTATAAHAQFGSNLIVNGGAEAAAGGDGSYVAGALPGWTVSGQLTNISYDLGCPSGYPCLSDPGPANPGANLFGGGDVATSAGTQTIDLGFAGSSINGNGAYFSLAGWLGGYAGQNDNAVLSVSFRNAANQEVGSSTLGPVTAIDRSNATALLQRQASGFVPLGAQTAVVTLQMNRAGGTSNDGYADNLSLSVLAGNVSIQAPSVATVGSLITARVAVDRAFSGNYTGDELLAFGFDLGYDTSLLRLSSAVVDPAFSDDTALFGGDISVAGSSFPGLVDDGSGHLSLATLTFEVLAAGAATIEVRSDSGSNLSEGLTYAMGSNAELFGRTALTLVAAPVPEPENLLLALGGLALVGAAGLRRRRAQA